jgi:ABC-type uncharacterized transport system permease subunit
VLILHRVAAGIMVYGCARVAEANALLSGYVGDTDFDTRILSQVTVDVGKLAAWMTEDLQKQFQVSARKLHVYKDTNCLLFAVMAAHAVGVPVEKFSALVGLVQKLSLVSRTLRGLMVDHITQYINETAVSDIINRLNRL